MKDHRDGFFPFLGDQIKDEFEALKREFHPDLVFTHYRSDRHQDHRLISDLTWNTFRDHLILEYEIPKYDGDLGQPNFFVPLADPICSQKIEILIDCFKSQRRKQWFDEQTFLAILRLRNGSQCSNAVRRGILLSEGRAVVTGVLQSDNRLPAAVITVEDSLSTELTSRRRAWFARRSPETGCQVPSSWPF